MTVESVSYIDPQIRCLKEDTERKGVATHPPCGMETKLTQGRYVRIMIQRKRLIEVSLPLKAISAQSAREKSIRHGHISTLHIWWARRPLAAMRAHPLGRDAAVIGEVIEDSHCFVQMLTRFGGKRVVDWLSGDQLPRIC